MELTPQNHPEPTMQDHMDHMLELTSCVLNPELTLDQALKAFFNQDVNKSKVNKNG